MLGFLTSICVLSVASGAKILAVWPVPSISHQVVFRPLTQELAKRGHDVTVITTDPAFEKGKAPPNLKEIDVHDISYVTWKTRFFETSTGKKKDIRNQVRVVVELMLDIFVLQMRNNEVKQLIANETFDLVFIEAFVRPALLFSYSYKVPVIQVSSFGGFLNNYERMGAPIHPLVYPINSQQRIYDLSMLEKVTELYNYYTIDKVFRKQEEAENRELRKLFGKDMPSLSELTNNIQMMFLNVHPYWDGNRPVPPSILYIGGIYKKPKKDLPKDLELYLNSSKNGVVYVSFGTNVKPSTLPQKKMQVLFNVLSQLPYDVLLKWDKDELPGRIDNIKIFKWLPQSDLLRHPNIKLFITQCGLQSTEEAISAGVPLLGIPLLGDQWFNAEKYVHHKIGVQVDIETCDEKILKNGVYEILNNVDSYRKNVVNLRALMSDQPQSALERAVWWTEHVLRHGGGKHLRAPTANITWGQYYELELVLCVLVLVLILGVTVVSIVLYLLRNLQQRSGKTKQS